MATRTPGDMAPAESGAVASAQPQLASGLRGPGSATSKAFASRPSPLLRYELCPTSPRLRVGKMEYPDRHTKWVR